MTAQTAQTAHDTTSHAFRPHWRNTTKQPATLSARTGEIRFGGAGFRGPIHSITEQPFRNAITRLCICIYIFFYLAQDISQHNNDEMNCVTNHSSAWICDSQRKRDLLSTIWALPCLGHPMWPTLHERPHRSSSYFRIQRVAGIVFCIIFSVRFSVSFPDSFLQPQKILDHVRIRTTKPVARMFGQSQPPKMLRLK